MLSRLFGPTLTTPALLAATGDDAWLTALLDAEVALAAAEAEVLRMEQQLSAVLGSSEAPLLRALDRLARLDTP